MRHRISYIHTPNQVKPIKAVNASFLELNPSISTAREDKFTLETARLSHVSALRIHITKPDIVTSEVSEISEDPEAKKPYDPFCYNYQVGVHVYATPASDAGPEDTGDFYAQVNTVLQSVLGIEVPREQWVLSLDSFFFHTSADIRPKIDQVPDFPSEWTAFDYYQTGSEVVVSAIDRESRALTVDATGVEDYTEVGIFQVLNKSTRHDLILAGGRVIMNEKPEEDEKVQDDSDISKVKKFVIKTLFHVKPRHRHLDTKATVSYRPNGLHPVVTIDTLPAVPDDDDVVNCKMFSYLTLEKSIFVDPYQLPEELTIVANYGPKDLELPEYSVAQWGNEVLMEFTGDVQGPVELTLHSRYQLPNRSKDHTNVNLGHPVLFYACDATTEDSLLDNSPFDLRRGIGGSFERHFTEDTIFYHFSDRGTSEVAIPNASGNPFTVNLITFVTLIAGILIVVNSAYKKFVSPTPKVSVEKKSQ